MLNKGYCIEFLDCDGKFDRTFMGDAITNVPGIKCDDIGIILYVFFHAHPGCTVLDWERMSHDEYCSRYRIP